MQPSFDAQVASWKNLCHFLIPGIPMSAMDSREASISSDIKSEVDSDRELVPDMESVKGSQGSDRVPLVGPGRGPVDPIKGSKQEQSKEPAAVDPNDPLLDNPARSTKESSAPSEKKSQQ